MRVAEPRIPKWGLSRALKNGVTFPGLTAVVDVELEAINFRFATFWWNKMHFAHIGSQATSTKLAMANNEDVSIYSL